MQFFVKIKSMISFLKTFLFPKQHNFVYWKELISFQLTRKKKEVFFAFDKKKHFESYEHSAGHQE